MRGWRLCVLCMGALAEVMWVGGEGGLSKTCRTERGGSHFGDQAFDE